MARWEPNAPERLQKAAFELYTQRGYDQTTVTEIAAQAGLTERTFFRHFTDKREVLFAGSERFSAALVDGVRTASPKAMPLAAAIAGVEAVGPVFPSLELVRARHTLIRDNPELLEREMLKGASLTGAVRGVLRERGTPETQALLAAEAGMAVMRVAISRWIEDPTERPWLAQVRSALRELRKLTATDETACPPSR